MSDWLFGVWISFVEIVFLLFCVSHILVFLWCCSNFALWSLWEICYFLYFIFMPRHWPTHEWKIFCSEVVFRILLTLYLTFMTLVADKALSEMERYILILNYSYAIIVSLWFGNARVDSELQHALEKSVLVHDIVNNKNWDDVSWPLHPDLTNIVKGYCGHEYHLNGSYRVATHTQSPVTFRLFFAPKTILRQTEGSLLTGKQPRIFRSRVVASFYCKFHLK